MDDAGRIVAAATDAAQAFLHPFGRIVRVHFQFKKDPVCSRATAVRGSPTSAVHSQSSTTSTSTTSSQSSSEALS